MNPAGALTPARRIDLFGYVVHVAPWLLDAVGRLVHEAAPSHTIVVITDEDVAPFYAVHVLGSRESSSLIASQMISGVRYWLSSPILFTRTAAVSIIVTGQIVLAAMLSERCSSAMLIAMRVMPSFVTT